MEKHRERHAFWRSLRLKLRARCPKELLFKMMTPSSRTKDGKLHRIKREVLRTDIVAVDCEMVGIGKNGNHSILARISIVNFFGDVLYDKLVKPRNDPKCFKVTDFRSAITGITRRDLIEHGLPFQECQREIVELLKGRKIVGHAINNDFAVMRCAKVLKQNFHGIGSWFFDSAKCELLHDDLSRPRSLKFLLELFLGVHIQSKQHDSVIDALSALTLYRAILPEIKAMNTSKRRKHNELNAKKREYAQRKLGEKKKRDKAEQITKKSTNYAHNNKLDLLIARYNEMEETQNDDNFNKQLMTTNPYQNEQKERKQQDEDVQSFVE